MDTDSRIAELEALVAKQKADLEAMKMSEVTAQAGWPVTAPVKTVSDFDYLKALLTGDTWPAAVDPDLICNVNSEDDKASRAEGIIAFLLPNDMANLKFLDFGCGEGHVCHKILSHNPALSVGYDPVISPRWEGWATDEKLLLTDQWNAVLAGGPYNVILLYDVIDHMDGTDAEIANQLGRLREVMAPNAKVYARCHPWCSRHGVHMYQTINKAFIHLVFTPDELAALGFVGMPTRKIIHPLITYGNIFKLSGLTQVKQGQVSREPVEPFFVQTPMVAARIKTQWAGSHDQALRKGTKMPTPQMEQCFIDFTLK